MESPPPPVPPQITRLLASSTAHSSTHEGVTVRLRSWGQPSASPPLVLLHGGSGSWTHWIANIDRLSTTRYLLIPDLPGFGESGTIPKPDGGTAFDAAPILAASLRAVAGSQKYDLVGFSFGGLLAALVMNHSPDLVRRIVLVGAPAFGVAGPRPTLIPWRSLPEQDQQEAHRRNLCTLMLSDPGKADDVAVYLHSWNQARDRMRKRGPAAGTSAVLDALRRYPEVRCDAVYGSEDALYRGVLGDLWRVLESLPNVVEKVVVEGAGHWVAYEAADEFGDALERILAQPAVVPAKGKVGLGQDAQQAKL